MNSRFLCSYNWYGEAFDFQKSTDLIAHGDTIEQQVDQTENLNEKFSRITHNEDHMNLTHHTKPQKRVFRYPSIKVLVKEEQHWTPVR